ncbi:MAG: tetratricopeptide repeat protein [Candidatus Coatesbacteria bacterium]|nr:tetratricopeptide repeat protein [Candidatus Coatesbacteria bacterium]
MIRRLLSLAILLCVTAAGAVEVREVPPLVLPESALLRELAAESWRIIEALEDGTGEVEGRLARLTDSYSERVRGACYPYHLALGQLAYGRGDLEGAGEAFRHAAELENGAAEPLAWLALLELRHGRLSGALARAEAALELDPLQPLAREVIRVTGLLTDEEEIGFTSRDPAALEALRAGDAAFARGDFAAAATAYRRALEHDPDFLEARIYLGDALLRSGEPAAALAELETALAAEADDARANYLTGRAHAALDDAAAAASAYRRALELRPDYPAAERALAELESGG